MRHHNWTVKVHSSSEFISVYAVNAKTVQTDHMAMVCTQIQHPANMWRYPRLVKAVEDSGNNHIHKKVINKVNKLITTCHFIHASTDIDAIIVLSELIFPVQLKFNAIINIAISLQREKSTGSAMRMVIRFAHRHMTRHPTTLTEINEAFGAKHVTYSQKLSAYV